MTVFSSVKRNKTLIGNISTLVGGTAFGRLITILAAPVLARLFTPEDFGIAALVITLAIVLNSISSLRYEIAIVLPPDNDQAIALSKLSTIILAVFCLLIALLVWLVLWLEWDLAWTNTLGNWSLLIPGAVFLLGIGNILRRWAIREKRFKAMSVGTASSSTVTAGSRIGLGTISGSTVGGLVIGYLAGLVTELYLIARSLGTRPAAIFYGECSSRLRDVARRYRDFALYSSPTALLKSLSDRLPIMLLGVLFNPAVVGFYAIAHRLVQVPIRVVGRSVRTVFLQRAIEICNEGRSIGPGFTKMTLGLAAVGTPVFLVLFAYGEVAFSLLLGERWSTAGQFAEVLAPLFFSMLVFAPMQAVFVVLERQRMMLTLQVIRTAAAAGAFAWGAHQGLNALDTLVLFSGLGVVTNMLTAIVAFWLAYAKPTDVASQTDQGNA